MVSALAFSVACGDDDDSDDTGSGGKTSSGGATSSGGTAGGASPDAGQGGEGAVAGAPIGGAGGEPGVSCEPPTPPVSSEDSGGAGGSTGTGAGVGGAESGVGGAGSAVGGEDAGGAESGAGGTESSTQSLTIVGEYTDSFDGTQDILATEWRSGSSVYHYSAFSNSGHWVVARNDESNTFNPCAWSRFDWTLDAGKLYYCQSAYAAATEAEALATLTADPNDLTTGCSGFGWSELTAR